MTQAPGTLKPATDRWLYLVAAIAAGVFVLVGFARTYYLKTVFGAPELPPLRHLHGLVMTLWFALFAVQTALVEGHRTALHRRLGVAGAVLALVVLVVGVTTGIDAAARGASPGPPPLRFLVVPLGDMVVFATLVGTALYAIARNRTEIHKRLMLVGTLSMLPAAIARMPFEFIRTAAPPPVVPFGLTDLTILACVAIDTWRHRRLHPAFAWGALFVVVSHPARILLAQTDVWLRFATWAAGWAA